MTAGNSRSATHGSALWSGAVEGDSTASATGVPLHPARPRARQAEVPAMLRFGQPATYDTVDTNGNPACSVAPLPNFKGPNPNFNPLEYHVPANTGASRIFKVATRW